MSLVYHSVPKDCPIRWHYTDPDSLNVVADWYADRGEGEQEKRYREWGRQIKAYLHVARATQKKLTSGLIRFGAKVRNAHTSLNYIYAGSLKDGYSHLITTGQNRRVIRTTALRHSNFTEIKEQHIRTSKSWYEQARMEDIVGDWQEAEIAARKGRRAELLETYKCGGLYWHKSKRDTDYNQVNMQVVAKELGIEMNVGTFVGPFLTLMLFTGQLTSHTGGRIGLLMLPIELNGALGKCRSSATSMLCEA
jgi:hypothetical protein